MANKRMFDKAIIDTDRFMDLPMSAKAIYFLLGMEADDEGFVSYKKVIRIHGGNDDDVKILAAKKLIIPFPSGVIVITDWHRNNWLDSRRIRPTEYQDERKLLELAKGSKYVLSKCLASIEESRVEENSIASQAPQFVLKDEIEKLKQSKRRDLRLIGEYFEEVSFSCSTKDAFQVAIKRHLKDASSLSKFSDDEIGRATDYAEKEYSQYTLGTLIKIITSNLYAGK